MNNQTIDKLNSYYYIRNHFSTFETEAAMEAAIKEENDEQTIEDQFEFKDFGKEMLELMINVFELECNDTRLINYLDIYAFVNDLAVNGEINIYYNFEKNNGQVILGGF